MSRLMYAATAILCLDLFAMSAAGWQAPSLPRHALIDDIERGIAKDVAQMLAADPSLVRAVGRLGKTALHAAAKEGNAEFV